MAERIQKQRTHQSKEQPVEEVQPAKDKTEIKDELDEILDEIDSVLEENAETFVAAYIQKGGQ